MGLNRGRGRDKVPAHATYRKSMGTPDLVPPKFHRQRKATILKETVEADYEFPAALNGNVFVDLRQDETQTTTATLTTITEQLITGVALRSYRYTRDRQIETLDETLVLETAVIPPGSAVITTNEQDALGNGQSLRKIGVVPNVFPATKFTVGVPIVIPEIFRTQVPEISVEQTLPGLATMPTLSFGQVRATDEQLDEFVHRTNAAGFNFTGVLPITISGSFRTTKDKQVEFLDKTLQDDSAIPTLPTAILDVTYTKIGNGLALEERDHVNTLFTEQVFEKEIPDLIPQKFRGIVPLRRDVQLILGTASVPPDPTAGELRHKEEQTNVFVYRDTREFRDPTGLPVSLTQYEMTRRKQIGTETVTLAIGLQTLAGISELTEKASVENLGNNTSIKDILAVSTLFAENSFEKSIPDTIPEKFRAVVPVQRTSSVSAGTAAEPTLGTGELEHSSEQLDVFTVRDRSTFRSTVGLPASLTQYRMSRNKQIGTQVLTLAVGLQTLTGQISELTQEAAVENLGNNTSLKDITAVPTLFDERQFEKSIPDVVPEKFRTQIPLQRSSAVVVGTAVNPPNPTGGELRLSTAQLDAFTYRAASDFRTPISAAVVLQGLENTSEFGGGVLDVIETLDDWTTLNAAGTDVGRRMVSSRVLRLDQTIALKESKKLKNADDWVDLLGTDIDTTYGVQIDFTERTVDANTTGGISGPPSARVYTEVKPLDRWHSKRRVSTIDTTALDNYALIFPGTMNLDRFLPPILKNVESVFEASNSNGNYLEGTPQGFWSGSGGFSLPQEARSDGTASMGADANFDVVPPFLPASPTTRAVFFLPMPVNRAAVLAKLSALFGSVNNWPSFNPQPVTIQCISRRIGLQARAQAHTQSGGGPSSCDGAASNGAGISSSTEMTIKTIRIPPTIHGNIGIDDVEDNTATVRALVNPISISGSCPITNGGADTGLVTMIATGEVHCTASATAPYSTAYPSSGKYLVECQAQSYKFNYAMIHTEIFDFIDL